MVAPLKLEKVIQILSERAPGWVLLDKVYKGNRHKMNFICDNGHTVVATWGNVAKGLRCIICSGLSKPKIDDIQKYIKNKFPTYELLTSNYENAQTKFKIKCNNGCIWSATWSTIKSSKRCGQCSGGKTAIRTISQIKESFIKDNSRYIIIEENEYLGAEHRILAQCKHNHAPFRAKVSVLNNHKESCPGCQIASKSNLEGIKIWCEQNAPGYKILNTIHVKSSEKLILICPNGHDASMRLTSFKEGRRCGSCAKYKNESRCRDIFIELLNTSFEGSSPEWLVNPITGQKLRFDGYSEELKLVFEYDGRQHFEPIDYFGGEDVFRGIKERDLIKDKLCKENNITLIRIPHTENKNLKLFIINKLKKLGFI